MLDLTVYFLISDIEVPILRDILAAHNKAEERLLRPQNGFSPI